MLMDGSSVDTCETYSKISPRTNELFLFYFFEPLLDGIQLDQFAGWSLKKMSLIGYSNFVFYAGWHSN